MLQSQISVSCGKGVWLCSTGWSYFRFSPCSSIVTPLRNYSVFIQHFPFLAGRTACLPQQPQWWLCCSGTGGVHVNFGNYWSFKAKGIWCSNEMLSQESKVCCKLINQDSCAIIFSNALVSCVLFVSLYLCMRLGEKKKKPLRNRRIQLQVLKDIFSL